MQFIAVLAVLAWLQVVPLSAQLGKECSIVRACMPHQSCYHGYCSCDPGYIRNDRHCFKARKYGETCYFEVQCVDHRMTCTTNNSVLFNNKLCLCTRYYEWDNEVQECTQVRNISIILSSLESSNKTDNIERSARLVFVWIVVSGLTVVVLGSILAISCIFYGCCLYECYDRWTQNNPDRDFISKCPPSCQNYQRTLA